MGHRYSIWLLIFSVMAFQVFVSIDAFSKDIQIADVPKAIQKIIFREIGDVPIDDIDREEDDGEVYFDVEAKAKGIRIELEIAEDGSLKERDVTEYISFSELPIPVQDTVHRHVGTLEIDDVERKTELGKDVYYDIEVDDMGVEIDLEIAADGTLLDKDMSDPIALKVRLVAKSKLPTLEDISPEMFKDLDHMNALGATNMTQKLEEIRLRHVKKYRKRR